MSIRRLAVAGSAVVLAALAAGGASTRAADVYVSKSGSDATGTGSISQPYLTIQWAYTHAASGDRIRVDIGTYTECVVAGGVKWVDIEAISSNNTTTTISAAGACPTLTIGGAGGSVHGFTIASGQNSGIVAFGSVTISNNRIIGNVGPVGGGVRYTSDTCNHGAAFLTITGNTFLNNVSDDDGGALSVFAGLDPSSCQVAPVIGLIEGNTFTTNNADDDGGAVEIEAEAASGQFAEVTFSGNILSNNTAGDIGGGAQAVTRGIGTARIVFLDNLFEENNAASGAGLHGHVDADEGGQHTLEVRGNTFELNDASADGGGMFLYLRTENLDSAHGVSLVASGNRLVGNTAVGSRWGGGGMVARHYSLRTFLTNLQPGRFEVEGNEIVNNTSFLSGGGLAVVLDANVLENTPNTCHPAVVPSLAMVEVHNNLIARNNALHVNPLGRGGGVLVDSQACQQSTAHGHFLLNTITHNATNDGAGGVDLDFFSGSGGLNKITVSHSILSDNEGAGLGGVVPPPFTGYLVDVDHSDVVGNAVQYDAWIGDRTGLAGNISVNPQYVNPVADDFRLQSTSPVIEAGDRAAVGLPSLDFDRDRRVIDANEDGLFVVDMGCDEYFACQDVADRDGYGDPVLGADICALDNCPTTYNPAQTDCDLDNVGDACDPQATDLDQDTVAAGCDSNDANPFLCGDVDGDSCDDCAGGLANPFDDGADADWDGLCNSGDPDDDNDAVPDPNDAQAQDPYHCRDLDGDLCDDCTSGLANPASDGADFDADGLCNSGDPDDDGDGRSDGSDSNPLNPVVCADTDQDTCEDCLSGTFQPLADGPDGDGDGICAAGDGNDANPLVCSDHDSDGCQDCSSGSYSLSNDGADFDGDGLCNVGDLDDDGDSVSDVNDCEPLVASVSGPVGVVTPIRLGQLKSRISWQHVPNGNAYNVYRGQRAAGSPFAYNHVCLAVEVPILELADPSTPADGTLYYYLVAGTNSCGGQGSLGQASSGAARPPGTPCVPSGADSDGDGIQNINDNCGAVPNANQLDGDADRVGDVCDVCPLVSDTSQANADLDGTGDACDTCTDTDGDSRGNPGFPASVCTVDNCPTLSNPGWLDSDADGVGNVCDVCPSDAGNDPDFDAVCAASDNCPAIGNNNQFDADLDGFGDVCDTCTDSDADGRGDSPGYPANTCPADNCSFVSNPGQANADGDGLGDACDSCTDTDGDEFGNPGFQQNTCPGDNCPAVSNPSQANEDSDGLGDACDPCVANPNPSCVACSNPAVNDPDGDGSCNPGDNCPAVANPDQANADGDGTGDLCDSCTDVDADGFGNPGYPANTCADDNCPAVSNPAQGDGDGDLIGDICDSCPADPDNDSDGDGFCANQDNCPILFNPDQFDLDSDGVGNPCDPCTDTDGDGFGNPGYPSGVCPATDNCPATSNPTQQDTDGEGVGDACDNCPTVANPGQGNIDGDSLGNVCDPCPGNPDLMCVPCAQSGTTDPDADGVCHDEVAVILEGTQMTYLANSADPDLDLTWVEEGFIPGPSWLTDDYGVGYDTSPPPAQDLIHTSVPSTSRSIYTRVSIEVVDPELLERVTISADWDDGYAVWINGDEVYRSPQMPAGPPDWDTQATFHEAAGLPDPYYGPAFPITSLAMAALHPGTNVVAIGVWNDLPTSSDLILVPRLALATNVDNCPSTPNANQQDTDGDGIGDACDNCYLTPNFDQLDQDGDAIGTICDPCPYNPNPSCVSCANSAVTDVDGDGICSVEIIAAQVGDNLIYKANSTNPNLGLTWTQLVFEPDGTWAAGQYGLGYDTMSDPDPNALDLIGTNVPVHTKSIYSRDGFTIGNVGLIQRVEISADWDDGYVAWINGHEIYRSPEMGAAGILWDSNPALHESSHGTEPFYGPANVVTGAALPFLQNGPNILALGVWNEGTTSTDLLIVPRLSIYTSVDNCPSVPNASQQDTDGDGFGDACDP